MCDGTLISGNNIEPLKTLLSMMIDMETCVYIYIYIYIGMRKIS